MNGVTIAFIAAKWLFLLITVYSALCLYDMARMLTSGGNGTFITRFNIFVKLFKINKQSNTLSVVKSLAKVKSAFKADLLVLIISFVMFMVAWIGQSVYTTYEKQLQTAAMAVQILNRNKHEDEIAAATIENSGLDDASMMNLSELKNEGMLNGVELKGNGTVVERMVEMLQQSYIDAGVPGKNKYGQYYITLEFNGTKFRERPDCTGLLNSVVKMMGYLPPGAHSTDLMKDDWVNSSSWCTESNYIQNFDGSKSDDWIRLDYDKDLVQPGDMLVRRDNVENCGHGEIAVGWDGNTLYGFNYGWNTCITYTQNACKDILENGTDPLEACKKAGSKLSPNKNWHGDRPGYKYIYRYVGNGSGTVASATKGNTGTSAGWVNENAVLIEGAPNTTTPSTATLASDTKKSNVNADKYAGGSYLPIIAAAASAVECERQGATTYSFDHVFLEFGDRVCESRPDCSAYMSSVMWLLGAPNMELCTVSMMMAREPLHEDGTSATEWEYVTLGYDTDNFRPGDIILNGDHTEMFTGFADPSKVAYGLAGFNYGWTGKLGPDGYGVLDGGGILATNAAANAVLDGMDAIEASETYNSHVSPGTGGWAYRYHGDGSNTIAEELGLLDGYSRRKSGNSADLIGDVSTSWVDRKDLFRHGGSAGTVDDYEWVQYKPGMANDSDYLITLNNGTYYWYHQTAVSDDCVYCGNWTSIPWGKAAEQTDTSRAEVAPETLGATGDPVYASAILISNLTNADVTPIEVLGKAKAAVASDRAYINTANSPYFDGTTLVDPAKFFTDMSTAYGLTVGENLSTLSEEEFKSNVDNLLSKGGLVLVKIKGNPGKHFGNNVNLKNHYSVIYKSESNNYYLLDQLTADPSVINEPIEYSELYKCIDGLAYGVINPNPPMVKVSKSGSFGNGQWYSDASGISTYKNRVDLGNNFYLYDGLPWTPDSSTYTVDTDQMLKDLFSYVETVSNGEKAVSAFAGEVTAEDILNGKSGSGTRMFASSNSISGSAVSAYGLTSGYGGTYKTLDGVQCICVGCPPAILDRYYCVGFGPYDEDGAPDGGPVNYWSQSATAIKIDGLRYPYDYGKRKMCLVLQKYDDNSVWYLPITHFDAKAHTFPGGVCQTGWTLVKTDYSSMSPCTLDSSGNPTAFNCYVCNSGGDFGLHWSGNMSELMSYMNRKCQAYDNNVSAWDCVWNVVEPWHVPNVVKDKVIRSNDYRVMGYVVYHDNAY